MSILLKNLRCPTLKESTDADSVSILIDRGYISSLNGKDAEEIIDLEGCFVTPGWMDLNANFHDPGEEMHEDLQTGSAAAVAGGFTDVQLTPQTDPVIDTKSAISFILKNAQPILDLHPCAAVSARLEGESLTEMLDLFEAGARSFSNGDLPIWNSELLLKALQYTQSLPTPIFQNARDRSLSKDAQMHEGVVSTMMGLRGEPALSEGLVIRRDLEILKYSGGRLHFTCLSTAEGVRLITEAKEQGLNVTADVGIHHLLFTEESVQNFDTHFKVLPHYRTETDRKALIDGLKNGVIDAICSNHRPFSEEHKQLEFDLAEFGNISLQTFFPSLLEVAKEVPLELLFDKIISGPRRVLGLEEPSISVGSTAKLTIYNPDLQWKLDSANNLSKSWNSPFWGSELTGKVVGTVNGDTISLHI